MKKTIRDYDLEDKKVIIRCDFNVPIKDNKITDDNRIKMSLETIKYAIDNNAKVILMSHLGRVETKQDKEKNSLKIVADRLSELLNQDVIFIDETRGKKLENAINSLKRKEVLLIENTRFEDLNGQKESKNDPELGKYWASLGDIFINDAFGTCHRAHASNVGIASNLQNGIGFLVEKEIEEISDTLENPDRPFTVILGGSKVKDKIKVIENLVKIADYILIGGGMAFTFLKSEGYEIGSSLLDIENLEFCKNILEQYGNKIILPVDTVCSKEITEISSFYEKDINNIENDDIGLDIGSKTIEIFKKVIEKSNTVIWNGPVGMFEMTKYSKGTKGICEALKLNKGKKIVGGGDTASAVINFGYKDYMTHISTGGGASLELLEGKILPGIGIIDEKK
ncbi:MAG: phosphoglycerate kinase [Firmicutes bacterium]|nr:phosphoglycerate kinase [Bacillota bacterium]